MGKKITATEFRALAELRYRIRLFLKEGDATAREAGLEPQQYLMLLAIRGLPPDVPGKIRTLADRLALKHHSAVELVDRLEQHGYVKRTRSREDKRQVLVSLLPKGQKLLERVVQERIGELRANGRELVRAIDALLDDKSSQARISISGNVKESAPRAKRPGPKR